MGAIRSQHHTGPALSNWMVQRWTTNISESGRTFFFLIMMSRLQVRLMVDNCLVAFEIRSWACIRNVKNRSRSFFLLHYLSHIRTIQWRSTKFFLEGHFHTFSNGVGTGWGSICKTRQCFKPLMKNKKAFGRLVWASA